MPQVEFEPTIPVFEQAKIFHAVDRVTGHVGIILERMIMN
jgi:hypothetical protein